jgi:TusA-related sulfurtransferase
MDLRGTPCPLNWVKTKLRLEEMEPGAVIEVLLDKGGPSQNVPRSASAEGYKVLSVAPQPDGVLVTIER